MSTIENKLYDGYHKYDREVAQTYEQSRQQERHWIQEDRFIKKYMQSRNVTDLLDVPVGTGRFFHHYTGVRSVIGVDISADMLLEAKQKLSVLPPEVSIRLEQGDIFTLPFGDGAFDAVIVFRLFHLMPEISLSPAIKELCRVSHKDVIAQTYVRIKGNRNSFQVRLHFVLRRFASLFERRNPSFQTTSPAKPWSHIQAYYHEQAVVDAKFATYGFLPSKSTLLDKYENSEVRATVYSKKI